MQDRQHPRPRRLGAHELAQAAAAWKTATRHRLRGAARLVEEDRRALTVGFSRQHNGVAHPAVPAPRAEFMPVARLDDAGA
jgi:hypothetical protein